MLKFFVYLNLCYWISEVLILCLPCVGERALHVFVLFMLSEGIKSGFDPIIHGKSLLAPDHSCTGGGVAHIL